MQIKYGSYAGNGSAGHAITGVGIGADCVIVKDSGNSNNAIFRTKDMGANQSFSLREDSGNITTGITSLDSDGFTLGTDSRVNTNGDTYYYIAIKNDGRGDFYTGTYAGNGSNGHSISTSFASNMDWLVIKGDLGRTGCYRSSLIPNANDQTMVFYGGTFVTGAITSLNSDGSFTLGSADYGNNNSTTYYYFGFKESKGLIESMAYKGTGSSQTINTRFQPGLVWVKDGSGAFSANFKTTSNSSTASFAGFDGSTITTGITAFAANSFTVGTDSTANNSGDVFYALVLYDPSNTVSQTYSHKRSISIDSTKCGSSDSANFPMLVSGTYAYLATTGNGGLVTSSSGYDIIFTSDSGGQFVLDHEIETYTASSGLVNFWVRVPKVSHSANTVIYMWYGNSAITASQENASGTWDGNYKAVWHLKESSGTINDSTANGVNSTATTGLTYGTAAQIGNGVTFSGNGSTSNVDNGVTTELNGATSATFYFWTKVTTLQTSARFFGKWASGRPYIISQDDNTSGAIIAGVNDGSTGQIDHTTSAVLTAGTWTQVAVTWSAGTALKIYVNGASVSVTNNTTGATGSIPSSSDHEYLGYAGSGNYLTGVLDEVEISNTARGADWILTEYNNQNSPSTFYTVGAEVTYKAVLVGQAVKTASFF